MGLDILNPLGYLGEAQAILEKHMIQTIIYKVSKTKRLVL